MDPIVLLNDKFVFLIRIFYRRVPGFATDCPWIKHLPLVSWSKFWNSILDNTWSVSLTWRKTCFRIAFDYVYIFIYIYIYLHILILCSLFFIHLIFTSKTAFYFCLASSHYIFHRSSLEFFCCGEGYRSITDEDVTSLGTQLCDTTNQGS